MNIYSKIQRELDEIKSPYLEKISVSLKFGTLLYSKPLIYKVFCFKSRLRAKKKICILGGVHGDEREPVLALIKFLKENNDNKEFFRKFEVTIFPLINPRAFILGKRNIEVDLNRCFFGIAEIEFFKKYVPRECDIFIDFHGDVCSESFYLYENKRGDFPLGRKLINKVRGFCRIASSRKILGDKNDRGIIGSGDSGLGSSHEYMKGGKSEYTINIEVPLKLGNGREKIELSYGVLEELRGILMEEF